MFPRTFGERVGRRDLSPPGRGFWPVAVLALVLVSLSPTVAHADADHGAIAKASLEQYIRPGYAQFAIAADALKQSVAALCQKPSTTALKDTKKAFAATVEAWSMVEPIRFGPVAQEHRFERIFYWPDPKGLGARQVREAIAKQDKTVTEPASLTAKSVALQGLPALEYLLYGDGAATLEQGRRRGDVPLSLRRNHRRQSRGIAKEIADGWQDGAPYTKSYLDPGPANAAYHTPKEVTLELFKTFTAGIEWVRDQKLAKTLGRQARAGKAAACALLAERAELRQHGRQSCRRARPVRQGRLRPSGASGVRRASRTRSCSISITPSRCCAAWTSRSPRPCATRIFAASSKPCAFR